MKRALRDLSAAELSGRRALVRVDYNVPLEDGTVADTTRIEATYPTLRHLLERGAHPVLMSHLGRPKGEPDPRYSLEPVAGVLERGFGARVLFVAPADGREAVEASTRLAGEEILLLENTRFLAGEKENDDALAERLAALGDLFVNDAFGSLHRAHASVVGVARHLRPAVAGLLVEAELEALGSLREEPARPFVVAFGGAKIGDKIDLVQAFLERADRLLIGGAMANTFLRSRGREMGASLVEEEALDVARRLLEEEGEKMLLPTDLVVTPDAGAEEPEVRVVGPDSVPGDHSAVDIGPETREAFVREVRRARTLFWNGPMGLFEREPFAEGTFALARAAAEATDAGAFTVIGGGDSASAVRKAGVEGRVSHVSTGGGASLEFLARGTLPGLDPLDEAPEAAGEGTGRREDRAPAGRSGGAGAERT